MIGIITINDNGNIGNRLQNYAVYCLLNKRGKTSNIIRKYNCEKDTKNRLFSRIRFFLFLIKSYFYLLFGNNKQKVLSKRYLNFLSFNRNIKSKVKLDSKTNYSKIDRMFSLFVVGSDQIWNPNLFNNNMFINMLGFCSDKRKKIALSPSISCDYLTAEQENEFKKYLVGFDYLSCREEQGSKLISKITGKQCSTLIDPTLMLSAKEWDRVSKPLRCAPKKKYILLYFLGGYDDTTRKKVHTLSQKYDYEIVDIYDTTSKYYACGPSEFIWLIKNCEIAFTDSFHAMVFSYLYKKPFQVFKRIGGESMYSRITNLIALLHINDSVLGEKDEVDELLVNHDYDEKYLKIEQQRFDDYLSRCFENEIIS